MMHDLESLASSAAATDAQIDGGLNLAEYWALILKRRILIATCVGAALIVGIVVSLMTRPVYRATVILDIEKTQANPADIGSSGQTFIYDSQFLATQTRLITSSGVTQRAAKQLHLTTLPGEIQVSPIRGTNLVEIAVLASSAKLASDIANAVADAYIDWKLEAKFLVVGQASQFLTAQIEQLKAEIYERERALQAYSRQKDIVSVDPQSNVTLQKLQSLNKDYADAVGDRVSKEAKYHEVTTARPDAIADTVSNGFVTQLRNDQAKMERQYAEKLNLFKPEWPEMQQLKTQIDKGRQHLDTVIQETVQKAREVARSDYLTALRREESLKNVLEGQKSEAMALNSNAVEYNNLRVEVETKRALMDTLLKRNAETQVASRLRGERLSNIEVVDHAAPPKEAFRPSYRQNALISLAIGLALGVALAFMLEYFDRSLRTQEDVERLMHLPALGIIPAVSAGRRGGYSYSYAYGKPAKSAGPADERPVAIELLPHVQPRSTVAESYRVFRAALLLSRAGGLKTIAITSTVPAEGKTSTALNLAVVLGQLGKRVLLIDADLHKPRLHETLRVSNRAGLVSILAESIPAMDVVAKTGIPNVFLIPSGPNSPNPSGLLASEAMRSLIATTSETFDYIVIDTPPVSAVADALLLGSVIDGVVLTVRGGVTPRDHIARVRDKLLRSNIRILGILINNLEEQATPYGKYYSYYARVPYGASAAAAEPSRSVAGR